jgi:hypothetical protein
VISPGIACIVEGHGEIDSVPILIRRIAHELDPDLNVNVHRPIRQGRGSIVRQGGVERAVELAARTLGGFGAIILLIDADDDCPATMGPSLLLRATTTRPDVPTSVVLANREFEAWFIAAARSLRGRFGLPPTLESPLFPEQIRGAKAWLGARMTDRSYSETRHQASLTAMFDLQEARRAGSFDKYYRDVASLLVTLRQGSL